MRRFRPAASLVVAFSLLLVAPAVAEAPRLLDAPPDEAAAEVVERVNQAREEAGCPALEVSEPLTGAARRHSEDMAENRFLGHEGSDGSTVDDRASDADYPYRRIAENVAAGPRSAEQAVTGWLESPSHREAILDCDLQETGVSVAENRDDPTNGTYWTQVFGQPGALDGAINPSGAYAARRFAPRLAQAVRRRGDAHVVSCRAG